MKLDDPHRLSVFEPKVLAGDDRDVQEIVLRAAGVMAAPTSAFTLALEHVQLFRAHVGLPSAITKTRGIDLERSPCRAVIEDELPLLIGDASAEAPDNPFFAACAVRAYASVPVEHRGHAIGTLLIMDPAPRRLGAPVAAALQGLSAELSALLAERGASVRPAFDTLPDPEVLQHAAEAQSRDFVAAGARLATAVGCLLMAGTRRCPDWAAVVDGANEALLSHEELVALLVELERSLCRLREHHPSEGRVALDELGRVRRVAAELGPLLRLAQAARGGLIDAHLGARSLSLLPPPGRLEHALGSAVSNVVVATRRLRKRAAETSGRLAG